jgi:hypothetical protein
MINNEYKNIKIIMSKNLTLSLLKKFNHGISQPQNMKRFYKDSTFIANPTPSHPMHRLNILLT